MFLFHLMFFAVFAVFLFTIGRGFAEWSRNNRSPSLSVEAKVVTKRAHHRYRSGTSYYVTFEVENRDRMELRVDRREYGMLVEGDLGVLSFQGTRYLAFYRSR